MNRMLIYGLTWLLFSYSAGFSVANDTYSSESPSKAMRLQPRAIKFLEEKPDDVAIKFEFEGETQKFGQFRYGTEDSIRVALVVDQLSDDSDDFKLYVDQNRDREITASELVEGDGRKRVLQLSAEVNQAGVPKRYKRQITLRRSVDSAIFSVATHGGCLANWNNEGKQYLVWRIDGDGNGLFSDNKDQLWIDVNQDGKWNPFSERFPFRPMILIDGQRFAVRADSLGEKTEFAEITGEGQLGLELDLESSAEIVGLKACIFGDDGSAHSIEGNRSIDLPVGNYTLGQITVKLKGKEERAWTFSFSHSGDPDLQTWYELENGGQVLIRPFDDLEFDFTAPETVKLDSGIDMRFSLITGDGLYITNSCRGEPDDWGVADDNQATAKCIDGSGKTVAETSSGFA